MTLMSTLRGAASTTGLTTGFLLQAAAFLTTAQLVARLVAEGGKKDWIKKKSDAADKLLGEYPSSILSYTGIGRAFKGTRICVEQPGKMELAKSALAGFVVSMAFFEAAHYLGGARYDLINSFSHLQVRTGSLLKPVYQKIAKICC